MKLNCGIVSAVHCKLNSDMRRIDPIKIELWLRNMLENLDIVLSSIILEFSSFCFSLIISYN